MSTLAPADSNFFYTRHNKRWVETPTILDIQYAAVIPNHNLACLNSGLSTVISPLWFGNIPPGQPTSTPSLHHCLLHPDWHQQRIASFPQDTKMLGENTNQMKNQCTEQILQCSLTGFRSEFLFAISPQQLENVYSRQPTSMLYRH